MHQDLYIKEAFDACYQSLREDDRIEKAIQYKEQLIVDELEYDELFRNKRIDFHVDIIIGRMQRT